MKLTLQELKAFIKCELFLTEGRIEDVKKKFPELDIDMISKQDPSGSHKYLMWMAKQISDGADTSEVIKAVHKFHNNIKKIKEKDINTYNSVDDLLNAISAAPKQTKREETKNIKSSGIEKIFKDEDVSVFYIKNKSACQIYGKGTKWCITGEPSVENAFTDYWDVYEAVGTKFYFILKRIPEGTGFDKVAIAMLPNGKIEIFKADEPDETIDEDEFMNEFINGDRILRIIKNDFIER